MESNVFINSTSENIAILRLTLITLLLSGSGLGFSQNLVPNPSFECSGDFCSFVLFRSDFYDCNWYLPTNGTTDKFSTTLTNKACYSSMPDNGQNIDIKNPRPGSQTPRTGTKFAGMISFVGPNPEIHIGNNREYLEVKLITPLVPGETYCAEMYVSRASGPRFAASHLGMYFHENRIDTAVFSPLHRVPQVYEKEVITSTDWVKVSGTFKATSAATHLTIGNFFDDSQTDFLDTKSTAFSNTYAYWLAYYFIDDVSVQVLPKKSFIFSGNGPICQNEKATIIAGGDFDLITWTTILDTTKIIGSGDLLQVTPQSTTSYRVKGKYCSAIIIDTVTVTVEPLPLVDLGRDTTLCVGQKMILDAGPAIGYLWNDGKKGRTREIAGAGIYSVTVSNEFNCTAMDQIKIDYLDVPDVHLGSDTVLCNTFYVLNAEGPAQTYTWSTGASTASILPEQAGTYWVRVKNQCGTGLDTIVIRKFDLLFVPNVITTNNDGINEKFEIQGNEGLFSVRMLNRSGASVFSSERYHNEWPSQSDDVPAATYYYFINYPGCDGTRRGWLQVIK